MKFLIWAGTGLVALLWTLTIAVMASLANWLAGSTDQAVSGLQTISQWPMPAWLSLWVDPTWLDPIKAMMAWGLDLLTVATPWLAPVLGWLAPLSTAGQPISESSTGFAPGCQAVGAPSTPAIRGMCVLPHQPAISFGR